jgi:hypothetical protein
VTVGADRLERRLFRNSEREAELRQAQEAIRQIELAAAEKAAEIDRLEHAIGQLNGSESKLCSHLLFTWTPNGYALHEGEGELPVVGGHVSVNGHEYAVVKLARSPLPGDTRRCAFLEPLQA